LQKVKWGIKNYPGFSLGKKSPDEMAETKVRGQLANASYAMYFLQPTFQSLRTIRPFKKCPKKLNNYIFFRQHNNNYINLICQAKKELSSPFFESRQPAFALALGFAGEFEKLLQTVNRLSVKDMLDIAGICFSDFTVYTQNIV
jgi:hypothetical protein